MTNIKTENQKQRKRREGPKKPKKITPEYLHNSGLYYLQRFAASKTHFKTVMTRKVKKSCLFHTDQDYEACTVMVDALCDKFVNLGLLNDELYTQGMVNSLRRQGKSKRVILGKLKQKGIPEDFTEKMLERLNDDNNDSARKAELRSALKLARRKKLGPFRSSLDIKNDKEIEAAHYKKALGQFARAGFSFELTKLILDLPPHKGEAPNIELILEELSY